MSAVPDVFGGAYAAILASKAAGIQIKSIQYGTISASSGTGTATITAVNTARTLLLWLGTEGTSSTDVRTSSGNLTLTNSTTVSFSTNGASTTTSFCAVEFY